MQTEIISLDGDVRGSIVLKGKNSSVHTSEVQTKHEMFELVIVIAFLSDCIVRDIILPGDLKTKDIANAVQFKFVNSLPVDSPGIVWQYRLIQKDEKGYHIRAAAIEQDIHTKLLEQIKENHILADEIILAPLLLTEDIFPGITEYGPPRLANFKDYLDHEENEAYRRFAEQAKLSMENLNSCSLFAMYKYCEKEKNIGKIKNLDEMVPVKLRPVRYKMLRRLNVFILLIALALCCVIVYNQWDRSYKKFKYLEQENRILTEQLKVLHKQSLKMAENEKSLKAYEDLQSGYPGLENVLLEITSKIPSHMWVKTFRYSNGLLDIAVESKKDDVQFYNIMKEGKLYELTNLRKNKGRDEQVEFTITMKLARRL